MSLERTETSSSQPFSGLDRREDLSGSFLGQFELEREIGAGASAVVYQAFDHQAGTWVAVKVLKGGGKLAAGDRDRFMDELRISRSLSHPNLVTPYDGGISRGHTYLVMRLARRGNLQGLLDGGALSETECRIAISQIGSALSAIHDVGLVHRDVKPGNVLVDDTDAGMEFLLTDLGIVQPLTQSVRRHPGTAGYSAPEQKLAQLVDQRADVFSLACLTYACLTGHPPWAGADSERTWEAVLGEPAPHLSEKRPDIPVAVGLVLNRAMTKSVVDRHRTTQAFTQALNRAFEGSWKEALPAVRNAERFKLVRNRLWLSAMLLTACFAIGTSIFGLHNSDLIWLGTSLVGVSIGTYLMFRPVHDCQMKVPAPPQVILETVAIDLRRISDWTSRSSDPGEVVMETGRTKVPTVALIPLALLGLLPALAALLAAGRPSLVRIRTEATDGQTSVRVRTTGRAVYRPVSSLLSKLSSTRQA